LALDNAYYIAMKVASVADLKNRLSEFLSFVERGEEIEIRKRNVPIARVVPLLRQRANKTQLGCGARTVRVLGDLTEPIIPKGDWSMFGRSRR
jgi:prevent-host-death family protein